LPSGRLPNHPEDERGLCCKLAILSQKRSPKAQTPPKKAGLDYCEFVGDGYGISNELTSSKDSSKLRG